MSEKKPIEPPVNRASKAGLVVPILLIGVGTGWLLTTVGVTPGIDWLWTIGLAVIGLLAFIVSGLDKVSIVIGPLFLIASGLSVLRQSGRLHMDIELPMLVIVGGILLLVARHPAIPIPNWIVTNVRRDG